MAYAAGQLKRLETLGFAGNDAARTDSAKYKWGFVTSDVAATVEGAAYFSAALAPELGRGDVIEASMNNAVGQTPVLKKYIVTTGVRTGDAANAIALQTTTAG